MIQLFDRTTIELRFLKKLTLQLKRSSQKKIISAPIWRLVRNAKKNYNSQTIENRRTYMGVHWMHPVSLHHPTPFDPGMMNHPVYKYIYVDNK